VVFFPDGQRAATGAGDNTVRIWDLVTGTEVRALEHTGRSGTLALSPDGKLLATGNIGTNVQIWNANTGQRLQELDAHDADVTAAAFAPDGSTLVSGDDRGQLCVWKIDDRSWTLSKKLSGHSRTITEIQFLDNSRIITASGDHTCGQWELAAPEGRAELRDRVLKHPGWVHSIDVSPNGQLAATACEDGKLRLWSVESAQVLGELPAAEGKRFNAVSFSPDGATVLGTSSDAAQIALWRVSDRAKDAEIRSVDGRVWTAQFMPDGERIVTVGGNDARVWSMETHRQVLRLSPHGAVSSAALSHDGKYAVTGSWDSSAKIWETATGRAIRRLEGGHTRYVNSVEFSPDDRLVLTASDDGTARLWDRETGKPLDIVLKDNVSRVLQATFSPDGERVLTACSDKTARLWIRRTGKLERTLTGHQWAVLCACFSANGRSIVTGSQDTTAHVWDATTGERITTLQGHTAAISAVTFSPDGLRVLTGSQDNTAKLWDAQTGKEILSLSGHGEEVTSVAFSPDGRLALTASRDGTAILWLAADWRNNVAMAELARRP
jgi:WD40 repeat protein